MEEIRSPPHVIVTFPALAPLFDPVEVPPVVVMAAMNCSVRLCMPTEVGRLLRNVTSPPRPPVPLPGPVAEPPIAWNADPATIAPEMAA